MSIPKVNLRKIKDKNGYAYMMDYAVNGKRRRKKIGTNKRLAEVIVAQKQNELTLGMFDLLPEEKLIVDIESIIDQYLSYLRIRTKPKTINRYINHLKPFTSFMVNRFKKVSENIRLIKLLYIEEYIEYLVTEIKWAPYTINRSLQTLSSMFIFAIHREYLQKNPLVGLKKLSVPEKEFSEYFTVKELENIWKTIDPFWLDFFQFIYNTGLRKGELINLKWDRVYLDKLPIEIRIVSTSDWDPKTGSSVRNVPLNRSAKKIIERQIGNDKDYVFISKSDKKIPLNSPYRAIKRALELLNLEGDIHKFRHTFASHLVMEGASIYEVKELLGHSKIEMTQKYAHLSPEHQESVVNFLDKIQ